ncbi:MAG: hypothetical protein ACRYGG_07735 [Janthinobacterium lividum]
MTKIVAKPDRRQLRAPEPLSEHMVTTLRSMTTRRVPSSDGGMMLIHPQQVRATEALVAEAKFVLTSYEAQHRADWTEAVRWLALLNSVVANPCGEEDFSIKLSALAYVLGAMPVAVFSSASLQDAMRQFKFWPAASDLIQLLERYQEPMIDTVSNLRKIANGTVGKMV